MYLSFHTHNYPTNYPKKMSGEFTYKVIMKDYVRQDGTSALYLQLFLDGKRKQIPLGINVEPKNFDKKKQRIKGNTQISRDYNLIIGKKIADINNIAVSYRLAGNYLTIESLIEDLTNPTAKIDFLIFWEQELEKQKDILKKGTYRQQKSTLTKIKSFKNQILFHEIDEDLIKELIIYCRKKLKNKETTVNSTLKNFKKYLHLANKKGIKTKLNFDDISVKSFKGDRTFLDEFEIKQLYN